ncbi:MAG: Crp/Fnr family transcriptional regulator [Beijerinckiaceae bacterium]
MKSDFETRNQILLSLRPEAQAFLQSRLVVKRLSLGQILYNEGDEVTHAIFPHEGVASYIAEMKDGRGMEAGSIGVEGFVGFALIMGGGKATMRSIVQVPGYASWISIADLDEALEAFPCVRTSMMSYAKYLVTRLAGSVACVSLHNAEQRISRWLLDAHDRMVGDTFQVTQASLSEMLGLGRPTVNGVCTHLMDSGAILYSRGLLTISNRDTLMSHSCECYERLNRSRQLRLTWIHGKSV